MGILRRASTKAQRNLDRRAARTVSFAQLDLWKHSTVNSILSLFNCVS